MRLGTILAVVAVAAGCVAPQKQTITFTVNEHYGHLENGLRVVLLPDTTAPLVQVDVRYEVGSTADPPGKAGLAHLVEHLAFRGRQGGPGQPSFSAVLRANSVYHNAHTSHDSTHYQALGRREDLGALLALEAARMGSGCETIGEEAFQREREVVRNEIRLRTGTAQARAYGALVADIYGADHPYGRLPGGDDAQLVALTRDDVCKFMRDHYTPARATLLVAGYFDTAATQGMIAATLGAVPPRAAAPLRPVPAVRFAKKRVVHDVDSDDTSVVVAFPLPPRHGKDAFTLPFIRARALHRARFSTLFYGDAENIETLVLGGEAAPVLAIKVTVKPGGDIDEARDAIFRAANTAHWGLQYTNEDLARIGILTELAFETESLPGRTRYYADLSQFDREAAGMGPQMERLKRLSADQIKSAVRAVLDEDKAMVVVLKGTKSEADGGEARSLLVPRDERRDELPIDGPRAAAAVPVPERPTRLAGARRFALANGLQVVFLQSTAMMPVLTAGVVFNVGMAHDPEGKRGLAAAATAIDSGTGQSRMVTIDGHAGPDSTLYVASALSASAELVIDDLAMDLVGTSSPSGFFDQRKKVLKKALAKPHVRATATADRALREAIYGRDHAYARFGYGGDAGLDDLEAGDIKRFFATHHTARNATLFVVGTFDEAKVEATVRKAFGKFLPGSPTPRIAPPTAPPARAVVAVHGPRRALLAVRIAYRAGEGLDGAHAARLVLAEMLARRAQVVRERLGASYALDAEHIPTAAGGCLLIAGMVDGARGGEALAALRADIDKLRRGEDFLADFVHARNVVLGRELAEATDSAGMVARLQQMATYDKSPQYADELVRAVGALSPRDVLALARKELDPAHEVVLLAGDRETVKRALAGAQLTATRTVDASQ